MLTFYLFIFGTFCLTVCFLLFITNMYIHFSAVNNKLHVKIKYALIALIIICASIITAVNVYFSKTLY